MRHSQRKALLETTILALVAILLQNFAGTLTALIFQFHAHSSSEKALGWDRTLETHTRVLGVLERQTHTVGITLQPSQACTP